MEESSSQGVRPVAKKKLAKSLRRASVVNVFEDISYAMLGIPDKLEWENTRQLDKPKIYIDQNLVHEDWDNVHDPFLVKNPKELREAACAWMKVSKREMSAAEKVWFNRFP